MTGHMPMLNQVLTPIDAAVFVMWTFALIAATHALFRSFIASEVSYRFAAGPGSSKTRRMKELEWEVKHRLAFSRELAAGSPMAAKRPLSSEQVAAKAGELERLARGSWLTRAAYWFATCMLCQVFWLSIAACLAYGDDASPRWVVATSFCQAGLAVSLSQLIRLRSRRDQEREHTCSGGSCGKAGK